MNHATKEKEADAINSFPSLTASECDSHYCHKCKKTLPIEKFRTQKNRNPSSPCRDCQRKRTLAHTREKFGHAPMEENKKCPLYLGVVIAEDVLSGLFDDILRMPFGNPGYDFICGKGHKIDVKSACLTQGNRGSYWLFNIKKNTTPAYFLCLAFDSRESLRPSHVWLIPGECVNEKTGLSISNGTRSLLKWKPYEKPLDKVTAGCDILRGAA